MRIPIQGSTQARALATRLLHTQRKVNLKIQVIDPVTVYLAQNQNDLQSGLDAAGNPARGLQLSAGIYDFLGVSGEIWAICNQQTDVEVIWWTL